MLRYGEDEHFDVISAFIKSIRGRTPTPACTGWPGCWRPARTPGTSPGGRSSWRRRTSAWPTLQGLVVADAAARAVEFVGLPEAALNLAHAVIYLATAPKSNTTMAGPSRACRRRAGAPAGGGAGATAQHPPVPGQQALGGRRYPHNDPGGFVPQEYRPEGLGGEIGSPERRVLPPLAPRRGGGGGRPPAGVVGRRPYDREAWHEFEQFRDPER